LRPVASPLSAAARVSPLVCRWHCPRARSVRATDETRPERAAAVMPREVSGRILTGGTHACACGAPARLWAQAASTYEKLKEGGSPEFNVFFRKVGATDEDGAIKGGWYPVGSLACPSSQEISKAIFSTEDAFLQGAFRIHGKQVRPARSTRPPSSIRAGSSLEPACVCVRQLRRSVRSTACSA